MIVRDATGADIHHVSHHLRAADRVEQFAQRFTDDPDVLAREIVAMSPLTIKRYAYCTPDGEPAVIAGVYLRSPRVGVFHMMSSDRAVEIMRGLHRHFRRRFMPLVIEPNLSRCECRLLAGRPLILRWVACFGFNVEGTARHAGKDGEDFIHVAWTRKD